ncbi:MAG TPA: orotidine 5'-phosphate decarboxylase / HUMPS family protein, partial [Candidatus Methylomirabilis sp.]|nr:orotidine 5'-phosphate decarboxylase / HUMPS family protein [Candidatus Methylomirabilis sp.]
MKDLRREERLIVAADFKPADCGNIAGVEKKVLSLAEALANLGVIIKVGSILRACGYGLITKLHDLGLKVFADLKLIDIPET